MWIGQAAMRYGNKAGIPIVSTNHAMPENLMDNIRLLAPVARPINYMFREYGARFHSKADFLTLPTQAAIDMFGATGEKVSVPMIAVSNGVDLSRFTDTKPSAKIMKKFRLPTDKPIVAYIGRLDAEKHIPVLIRAFVRVLASVDAHLLVVGDGTEVEKLHDLVRKFGIQKKVTFTGKVTDDEIVELHKVGAVYCMPSPAELQSIATLEAMASGKPIVAVDAGALRELCQDDRNGYLCQQDDDEEIAAALTNILLDSKLRQKMGKESLAIARTHDLQETLKKFEEIYQSLIK
jgi:glycosyltransferase involved in cell wall biosynthesis